MSRAPRLDSTVPCEKCGRPARRKLTAPPGAVVSPGAFLNFAQTGLKGCAVGPRGESIIEGDQHRKEVARMNDLRWD